MAACTCGYRPARRGARRVVDRRRCCRPSRFPAPRRSSTDGLDPPRPGRRALPRRHRGTRPVRSRRGDRAGRNRSAGRALLLRDAGSPVGHPQPRRPRRPAAHHPGGPAPGPAQALHARLPIDIEDESQLPEVVAEQARRGDGWVKLVGDWIDRASVIWRRCGRTTFWWEGHRRRTRQRRPGHRARVRRGRAAGPDRRRHRLHRARHRHDRRHHRDDGRARHRLVPTLINIDNFPDRRPAANTPPTRPTCASCTRRAGSGSGAARPGCRSTPEPTPAA